MTELTDRELRPSFIFQNMLHVSAFLKICRRAQVLKL